MTPGPSHEDAVVVRYSLLPEGPCRSTQGQLPTLDNAIGEAMRILRRCALSCGFLDASTDTKLARGCTVVLASALQGVTPQIRHQRLRLSASKIEEEIANICKMLVAGLL